jgi:hypothetical protein
MKNNSPPAAGLQIGDAAARAGVSAKAMARRQSRARHHD